MIDDPPLLHVSRDFKRPPAEIVAGFAGAQTGHVVDAMSGSGALHSSIKPLVEGPTLVGVALTSHSAPADNLGLFASLSLIEPGDVLVASASGHTEAAITGDLLMGMARNLGAAGFVTDGAVRDKAGLIAVGLPVYSAALTPNSPVRNGPGTMGLPIIVGGVAVRSGDIVVADADGVVIVPQEKAAAVLAAIDKVRAAEAALEAKVKAGLGVPDFISAIVDSDRTVEV